MKAFENRWDGPYKDMEELDGKKSCCGESSFWWKDPPKDNILVSYMRENSMHGLKYVVEPRRHLSERICWILAFLISVAAAAYLINSVWDNYKRNPVIVSFRPKDTDIGEIPFPAVTICNMNKFPKSSYEKLLKQAKDGGPESKAAMKSLRSLENVCGAQQSFAQVLNFSRTRGIVEVPGDEDSGPGDFQSIYNLLMSNNTGCERLIRLCRWSQENRPCSEIFKPVFTEFGKCCTFNMLPIPLLRIRRNESSSDDSKSSSPTKEKRNYEIRWNSTEVEKWKKWNYDDGYLLTADLEYPSRQTRAGLPYGLSLLVDPNLEEYFCPFSDSIGVRVVLHNPLETPPMMNLGVPMGVGREIFMDVYPSMTIADPAVAGFPHDKRNCFFQDEKHLEFFKPYTTSNCMEECLSKLTAKDCDCLTFYMPKGFLRKRVCSSKKNGRDYNCTKKVQAKFTRSYRELCPNCDTLCTDISYHFETTQASLLSSDLLWKDPIEGKDVPDWADHNVSIIHIYFGSGSFVPQVRGQLYAAVDLIANTGGLLGLCLGFSALSAVEIIYFFSLRWFCRSARRKNVGEKIAKRFVNALDRSKGGQRVGDFRGSQIGAGTLNRVIHVNRNILPVYPAYSYDEAGVGQRRGFRPERY